MNILGKVKLFKKEINGKELYSTSISNKNIEGQWDKMYISVQLPKDVVIENGTDINITKGFLSFYKNKDGLALPKVIVQEFQTKDEIEERNAIEQEEFYQDNQNQDLPF